MSTSSGPSPMRVLIVLASDARRGAEIEGSRLADELTGRGIRAEAVALAPGPGSSMLDVCVLGPSPLGLSTLRALRRRAREFDVAIAYGSSSLPASVLALTGTGVPFVYRSIGDPAAWVRGRFHRWRTGFLMRRAAHVIALWPEAADSIQRLYSVDAEHISVIPNARSRDEFRPSVDTERIDARASLGLPLDARVVSCVGSISAEKRLHLAVSAIALLPGVHLLVVGDGPGRAELERQAHEELGGRVTFTGVLDDVVPVYRAIDVLLLTSRTEGMPGVILEAAMSGVPVVSTDVGAVRWTVDQGAEGIVTDRNATPDELADAIATALDGPRVGDRRLSTTLDWRTTATQWCNLLERLRAVRRPGSRDRDGVKVLAVMDSTGGGGAELSMAAMAPLLAEHGIDLEVAYFHDRSGAREKFLDAGIPLIHVPPGRSRLTTAWRLRRVITRERPDLVHTMVFEADIIGRSAAFAARTPVMSSIISDMYGPSHIRHAAHPRKLRLAQLADIATARFVRRFHAVSHTVADSVGPRLFVDPSRIVVIHRGRSTGELGSRTPERRAATRAALGIADDVPLVLAVGRLEPPKGFDVAIHAMTAVVEELPTAILLIAGRIGSSGHRLEVLVEEHGLGRHVRFLGHRLDVPDLLAACDVVVAPSRWEGLPGAALEAILIGTPLVCSDLPVFRELVGIAGVQALASFVPVDSPEAFAVALVEVLQDRGVDRAPAGHVVSTLTIEEAARSHARLYRSISAGRPMADRAPCTLGHT
jgi:glycosyltransferase involved in cell wall biosynthesis